MRISDMILSKGCPILSRPTVPVDFGDDKSIQLAVETAEILIRAYKDSDAVGLAAPQVGRPDRVAIIGDIIAFNPRIVKAVGRPFKSTEGCLSIPGQLFEVYRFMKVWLEYQDQRGRYKLDVLYGMGAAVAQHEIDHLSGVLLSDKVATDETEKAD